jgi:hypothetical protein
MNAWEVIPPISELWEAYAEWERTKDAALQRVIESLTLPPELYSASSGDAFRSSRVAEEMFRRRLYGD